MKAFNVLFAVAALISSVNCGNVDCDQNSVDLDPDVVVTDASSAPTPDTVDGGVSTSTQEDTVVCFNSPVSASRAVVVSTDLEYTPAGRTPSGLPYSTMLVRFQSLNQLGENDNVSLTVRTSTGGVHTSMVPSPEYLDEVVIGAVKFKLVSTQAVKLCSDRSIAFLYTYVLRVHVFHNTSGSTQDNPLLSYPDDGIFWQVSMKACPAGSFCEEGVVSNLMVFRL